MMLEKLFDNLGIGIVLLEKGMSIRYMNRYSKEFIKAGSIDSIPMVELLKKIFLCRNPELEKHCPGDGFCENCNIGEFLKKAQEYFEGKEMPSDFFQKRIAVQEDKYFEVKLSPLELDEKLLQIEFYEITEKVHMESMLKDKKRKAEKLASFLDGMQDLVFYADSEGRLQYINKAYEKFLGVPSEEVLGSRESKFFPAEMAAKCESNNRIALEKGTFFEEENFGGRWFQTFKGRVEHADSEVGILGVVRDITKTKSQELELKNKIYTDSLTGLLNRNFFEEKLRNIYENNIHKNFSLIVIDLDNLKTVNDTLGHDKGDIFIKECADIIRKNSRSEDYVMRIGGDEFCIAGFLEENSAVRILSRIDDEIKKSIILGVGASASLGAAFKKENELFDEIYKKADKEMYKSKKLKKSGLKVF